MQASSTLTLLFTTALIGSLLVKFWLTTRQVRHVAAHRDAVPDAFRQTVALAAHQRAADYTLAKSGHVRGDVLYGFFRPRTQATIDLILFIVFFVPGVFALTYAGYYYAAESWAIRETSNITAEGPPIYPFKMVIPLAGAFLLVQGIVEIIRCVICIRQGDWPSREEDVEEVDVDKLKAMVHVKDEDIAKLDELVVRKEAAK